MKRWRRAAMTCGHGGAEWWVRPEGLPGGWKAKIDNRCGLAKEGSKLELAHYSCAGLLSGWPRANKPPV
jgi:hypothetical protein